MDNSPTGRNMTTYRRQLTDHKLTDRLAKACIDRHNQADIGLRKERKDHAEVIKRCHNQASKGLERPCPTGASLACQVPPEVAPDRLGQLQVRGLSVRCQ